MKSPKFIGVLLILLLGLGSYSWFFIVKPEREESTKKVQLFDEQFPQDLIEFHLTTDEFEVQLEKRQGVWWVTSPREYLANQEYIEKSFRIMNDTVSNHHFPLQEDRFGLTPGKAFYRLRHSNGLETRIRVGGTEGPAETIYLLDQDSKEVFVVHNVWAQFLYYPIRQFYHPNLPIPGAIVKQMTLRKGDLVEWKVEPADGGNVRFSWRNRSIEIPKANGLWFFKRVKEFGLQDLEFGEPKNFKPYWRLSVESDKGNIIFQFNKSMEKVWVKKFNIFAQVNPYSLKSLGYEIEKVFKSDQK